MTIAKVYNTFINRYLHGEVPMSFDCYAYLVNSKYENLADTKYYLENLNDFDKLSANSIKVANDDTVVGDCLCTGTYLNNKYYRSLNTELEDLLYSPLVVMTENFADVSSMLTVNGQLPEKYENYITNYGFFYAVRRNDEFAELAKMCKNKERFVVVLLDDIDNVVVNGNIFGNSQEHPFRGIFDGNGYNLRISTINADTESNGLFGYIAEEGVVSSVNILQTEDSDHITVNSKSQINLSTIKKGKGDVKYGVLAGTNYGTIKNITVEANIEYEGNFRPAVYFEQNKQDSSKLVSDSWRQINASSTYPYAMFNGYPASAVTALTDLTNICYPTQLCLNNVANVIPYVGYFNEGAFKRRVYYENSNLNTMYTETKWDDCDTASVEISCNYTTQFGDVYSLYLDRHKKVAPSEGTRYYESNYTMRPWLGRLLTWENGWLGNVDCDAYGRVSYNADASFRLGPNDKAAYLIGNIVGFNAGNIQSAVAVTTATFNSNTVALIGGLAGRDAGGKIDDTYVCTTFVGTSGMFTDYIDVDANETLTAAVSSRVNSSLFDDITDGKLTVLVQTASNPAADIVSAQVNASQIAEALKSTVMQYISYADSTICRAYVKNMYDDTLTHVSDLYQLTFSGSTIPADCQVTATAINDSEQTYTIKITDFYIPDAIGAINNHTTDVQHSFNIGYLMNASHTYSAVSAVNLQDNTVELVDPLVSALYAPRQLSASLSYTNEYTAGSITFVAQHITSFPVSVNANAEISAYSENGYPVEYKRLHPITQYFNPALTEQQRMFTNSIRLQLYPIVNIGGMFGEYVYSNGQRITNSRTEIYAKDFSVSSLGASASYNSDFNTISQFAGNVVFDSSNKSNSDFYRNCAASAETNIQNELQCTVQSLNTSDISARIINCDAFNNSGTDVRYIHFMHCYNQLTPALVTTNVALVEHAESCSRIPDIGIQYCDQLFFEVGIQVGTNPDAARFDDSPYTTTAYNIYARTPYSAWHDYTNIGGSIVITDTVPLSGVYFGYPAQISAADASTQEKRNAYKVDHPNEYKMWFIDSVYDTAFKTTGTTVEDYMYVTNQLLLYPTHYPLYRGRMAVADANGSYDIRPERKYYLSAHMHVPVLASTYDDESHFGKPSKLVKDAMEFVKGVNTEQQSDSNNSNYVYTYSSDVIYAGRIMPVKLNLTYNDAFYTANAYTEEFQSTDESAQNKLATYMLSAINDMHTMTSATKCYAASSTSYSNVIEYQPLSMKVNLGMITTSSIKIKETFDETESVANVIDLEITAPEGYTVTLPEVVAFIQGYLTEYDGQYQQQIVDPRYYTATPDGNTIHIEMGSPDSRLHKCVDNIDPIRRAKVDNVLVISADIDRGTLEPLHKEYTLNFDFLVNMTKKQPVHDSTGSILSANSLVYSYVPTHEDITHILDSNENASLTCTGLSANDLQYVLIADEQHRPVMDIALNANEVSNNGYIVDFSPLVTDFSGSLVRETDISGTDIQQYKLTVEPIEDKSKGMAINIENGNK